MADRTVKVRVEAEASGFPTVAAAVAALGKEVDRTSKTIGASTKQTDAAGKSVKDLGVSWLATGIAAGALAAPAAMGPLLALPGIAGTGTVAMATLAVATHGVGDAFTATDPAKFVEAMSRLAPAAQSFVVETKAVGASLKGLQQATQQSLFAPLIGDVQKLSQAYLPALKAELPAVAAAFGQAGDGLVKWASSAGAVQRVQTIMAGTTPLVRDLGVTTENVGDAFLTLGAASLPAVQQLSTSVRTLTGDFRSWVTEAQQSGKLGAVFTQTGQTVTILESIVRNLGATIGNVFANPATIEFANNLLQTMNVAAVAVRGLTSAFASLPGPLQQGVLAMGAMYLASSRFAAIAGTMGGALTTQGARLSTFGDRGAAAGSKMSGFGTKLAGAAGSVGIWGAVIAVAGTAFVQFASAATTIPVVARNIDKLAASMLVFANTGKITGELRNTVGASFADISVKAASAGAAVEKAGTSYSRGMQHFAAKNLKQVTSDLKAVDQALVKMAGSGGATQAKIVFEELAEKMRAAGASTKEINAATKGYQATAAGLKAANSGVAQGFGTTAANARTMAQSLQAAVNAGQTLLGVFTQLNGGAIGTNAALVQADNAVKALTSSFQSNGNTINQTTVAGRANVAVAAQLTTAAAAAAQAKYQETGSVGQAAAVWNTYIAKLRAAMTAARISKPAQDALIASIGKMPEFKAVKITVQDVAKSTTEVAGLQAKINTVKGKIVQVQAKGGPGSAAEIAKLDAQLKGLKDRLVKVTAAGTPQAAAEVGKLQLQIKGLQDRIVQVKESGAPNAQAEVKRLDAQIKALQNKVVKVTQAGAQAAQAQTQNLNGAIKALRDKQVRLSQTGGQAARAAALAVASAINALQSRTVTLTTIHQTVYRTSSGEAAQHGGGQNRWGNIYEFARGGMTPAHIATGDVMRYAEKATGGEAFIPRFGDLARSRSILKTAADWLGGPDKIWPQKGAVSVPSSGTSAGAGSGSGGGSDMGQVVAAAVERGIQRGMDRVQVQMDGRVVGTMQGRRANLLSRAG